MVKILMNMIRVVVLLFVLVCNYSLHAQQHSIEEVHSMMIYNFTKYVNWPEPNTSGDFVMGVIGEDKVYQLMHKLYNARKKGAQKILVKKFNSVNEISGCHLLYIGKNQSKILESVLAKVSKEPILVITDRQGLAKRGSAINFRLIDGKFKFELNRRAIEKAKLKVSSQLVKMAILI